MLGIDLEGRQDILSIHIASSESGASWVNIFNDLKLRRVQDILFLFSDNLTGLQQAVDSCFPTSTH